MTDQASNKRRIRVYEAIAKMNFYIRHDESPDCEGCRRWEELQDAIIEAIRVERSNLDRQIDESRTETHEYICPGCRFVVGAKHRVYGNVDFRCPECSKYMASEFIPRPFLAGKDGDV